MSKSTEEKIKKIQELVRRKEEIEAELDALLSPEKALILPVGFSLNNEVLSVIKEAGVSGIDTKSIVNYMRNKYPKYGIERSKVASVLAYLKNNKKQIDLIGRGVYRIKE